MPSPLVKRRKSVLEALRIVKTKENSAYSNKTESPVLSLSNLSIGGVKYEAQKEHDKRLTFEKDVTNTLKLKSKEDVIILTTSIGKSLKERAPNKIQWEPEEIAESFKSVDRLVKILKKQNSSVNFKNVPETVQDLIYQLERQNSVEKQQKKKIDALQSKIEKMSSKTNKQRGEESESISPTYEVEALKQELKIAHGAIVGLIEDKTMQNEEIARSVNNNLEALSDDEGDEDEEEQETGAFVPFLKTSNFISMQPFASPFAIATMTKEMKSSIYRGLLL
eukprot:Nk52_evm29s252 gene=Nk52_evmTU29s252